MSPTLLTYRLRVGFVDLFFGILYRCLLAIIPVIASKNGRVPLRVPLPSPGTGDQGEAVECFRTKSANSGLCPPVTARNKDEVMNCPKKGSTSDERNSMPCTGRQAPAHRHRSTGAHRTVADAEWVNTVDRPDLQILAGDQERMTVSMTCGASSVDTDSVSMSGDSREPQRYGIGRLHVRRGASCPG